MSGTQNFSASGPPSQFSNSELDSFLGSSDFNDFLSTDDTTNFDTGLNADATASPIDFSDADISQFFPSAPVPQGMIPMQAPTPIPAPMPVPQMGTPCFHPAVGWYYPAQAPLQYAPVGMPLSAMSNEGYIPIAPPAPQLQMPQPQRVSLLGGYGTRYTPQNTNQHIQGQKRRQIFGPASYFANGDQAKRQKTSTPVESENERPSPPVQIRPVAQQTRPIAQPTPTVTEPSHARKLKATSTPRVRRRGDPPSIDVACVCATGVKPLVKRPKNPFIIFRMQQARHIARELGCDGKVNHQSVSTEAGALWKAMTPEQQQPYRDMAEKEKALHQELYPDYKYVPTRKSGAANFGTKDCTCGAYQRNCAKSKRHSAHQPTAYDSDPEELEAYAPPRTMYKPVAPFKAPTAQMTTALPAKMPNFGFANPAQNAEAAATFLALQAQGQQKAAAAAASPEQPIRRSARAHANITYTEPDDIVDETDLNNILETQLSEAFAAPSPDLEGKSKKRPSAISTPYNSPPSQNTRSRNPSLDLDLPTIPENNSFGDLFGEDGGMTYDGSDFLNFDGGADADAEGEADDDNIVVSHRRRSSSRRSSSRAESRRSSANGASPRGVEKRRASRSPRHSPRRS